MPADRDIPQEDMRYAEHLLEVAYRELQELDDNDPASVASVVLNV
jgi:hypothetical protein